MRKRIASFLKKGGRLGAATAALAALCIAMALYFAYGSAPYSEVAELAKTRMSFKELSTYFADIANEKGAVYAFEILKRAPIPPGIDIHLLGHVVGDILYKQKGAEGIMLCTSDFRNACSHTIVIGTLLEKGPGAFSEIADLCRRAPGGSGAYSMCFHGLGHGVLAYNDYELPLAVKMCEQAGAADSRGREYVECVGGTIMEMIAGVHDREMWEEKTKKYFKKEDPLYPCSAEFIPESAKGMCYSYITPHLFDAAGASMGRPTPENFKEAFTYCEPLQGSSRSACLSGFGKEFVVLAQSRDIRAVANMRPEQMANVLDWCELSASEDGKEECIDGAMNSLFWGGENDPKGAVRFCEAASRRGFGAGCYDNLFKAIQYFIRSEGVRAAICSDVPEPYSSQCKAKLL